MAIVNQLSFDMERRDTLINNRNGFTYAANITILLMAYFYFTYDSSTAQEKFREFSIIAMILGAATSIFYIQQIDEVKLTKDAQFYDAQNKQSLKSLADYNDELEENQSEGPVCCSEKPGACKTWKCWIKCPIFWITGTVYMVIRVAVNVNMTMLPFYLDKVTKFSPTPANPTPSELALVPLLSYIMSMVFSIKF